MVSSVQRWLARALVSIGVCASVAGAQAGQITGRVTDAETGSPVSDVRVEMRGGGTVRSAMTTPSGSFRTGLPAGDYVVTFARVGYAVATRTVNVGPGATVAVDVALTAVAIELNPTIISAGRTEEKALEAPASVAVVPERDIQENPTLTLNDQIKTQPGVDMAQTGIVTNNTVTRGFNNVFSGSMLTLTDNRYAFVPSLRVNTSFLVPTATEDMSDSYCLSAECSLHNFGQTGMVSVARARYRFTDQGFRVKLKPIDPRLLPCELSRNFGVLPLSTCRCRAEHEE